MLVVGSWWLVVASAVVLKFPNRKQERMVDALASKGDEGRGMAAISFGEVSSNL